MTGWTRDNPTDETPLYGAVLAAPDKPRAVIGIVHGFGEHIGRYKAVAPLLAARGYAVMGLDLHGHGQTPGPRGYVADYERLREDVDMLIAEIRARYPQTPFVLWGHSMGGGLVLDYVLDRGALERERSRLAGVVATGPLLRAVDAPSAPALAMMRVLAKVLPRAAIANTITGDKITTIPAEQALYEDDTLNHDRMTLRLGASILSRGEAILKHADRFPVPLMLAHARGDQLTQFAASEQFADRCPDCNFHAFEGVEHEIHNDTSRAELVERMDAFITARITAHKRRDT